MGKKYTYYIISVEIAGNRFLLDKESSWYDGNIKFLTYQNWVKAKRYRGKGFAERARQEIIKHLKLKPEAVILCSMNVLIADDFSGEIKEGK